MERSVFHVSKMDCPAEESLIRLHLDGHPGIKKLDFDIRNRALTVFHEGAVHRIEALIADLNLGSTRLQTEPWSKADIGEDRHERKVLWAVLGVNFTFFVVELATGVVSRSMGLVADSLDMLADAFVYAISLFAVGSSVARKRSVAKLAGYLQILLALTGFAEVIRRVLGVDNAPDFPTMIVVSILALAANVLCLLLLQNSKSQGAHMQASVIFTSNDVVINLGVIAAGVLVWLLNSNKPDLLIGTIVFVVVVRGAFKILNLAR